MTPLFTPGPTTVSISAGPISDRVALPAAGGTCRVCVPYWTETIFIVAGDETVNATIADGMPVLLGAESFDFGSATHVAAITASGSAQVVYFTPGQGV